MRTSIYRIPSLFRQRYEFLGFAHRTLLLPGLIFGNIFHIGRIGEAIFALRLEYTVLSLRYLSGPSLTTMKSSDVIRLLYRGVRLCPYVRPRMYIVCSTGDDRGYISGFG